MPPDQPFTLAPPSVVPDNPFGLEEDEAKKAGERSAASRAAMDGLQKEIDRMTKMFHGDSKPETIRDQVKSGKISPTDFFRLTGRIYAGAPQAKTKDGLDPSGNQFAGLDALHAMNDPNRAPLGANTPTPGLDAFHKANPGPAQPPASVLPGPGQVTSPAIPKGVFDPAGPQQQYQSKYGTAGVSFVHDSRSEAS
jgi:hypothetical protein